MKIKRTNYPVLDVLRKRWSPRAFSTEDITDDELKTILEAAVCAPSAFNKLPWKYLYARRGSAAFNKMIECMSPVNAAWADKAAVLMIGAVKRSFDGEHINHWAEHDMGAAEMAMYTQAASMDIYGHTIAGFWSSKTEHVEGSAGTVGFDAEMALKNFKIPADYEPYVFISLGRLGNPDQLPERYRESEAGEQKIMPIEDLSSEIQVI